MPPKGNKSTKTKKTRSSSRPMSGRTVVETKVQAPVARVSRMISTRSFPMTFGSAPPTQNYPEGGLRLSFRGVSPVYLAAVSATDASAGPLVGYSATSGAAVAPIHMILGTSADVWGSTALDTPIPYAVRNIAVWFSQYRINRLYASVRSNLPTSTSGSYSLAYEQNMTRAMYQTASQLGVNWNSASAGLSYVEGLPAMGRTAVWDSFDVPLIQDRRDRDNPMRTLYWTNKPAPTSVAQSSIAVDQIAQGCMVGFSNRLNASLSSSADIILEGEVDFYGLATNITVSPQVASAPPVPSQQRGSERKEETKEVLATPLASPRLRQLKIESSTGDFELVGGQRTGIPSARPGPPEKSGTGSVDGSRSGWFRA